MGRPTPKCSAIRLVLLLGILLLLSANLSALVSCQQDFTFNFAEDLQEGQINDCKNDGKVKGVTVTPKFVNIPVRSSFRVPAGADYSSMELYVGEGKTSGICGWVNIGPIRAIYRDCFELDNNDVALMNRLSPHICIGAHAGSRGGRKKITDGLIALSGVITHTVGTRAWLYTTGTLSYKAPVCSKQTSVNLKVFRDEKPSPLTLSRDVSPGTTVVASFAESSATFVVAYKAPPSGFEGEVTRKLPFEGEITHKLPFDYADYKNGLVKLTPAPLRVESGSVVATWDVKLAPAESFKVTVEVAKPVDVSVMEKFEAPAVNPVARPVVVSPGFVSPDGSKLLSVSEDFTKIELGYSLPPVPSLGPVVCPDRKTTCPAGNLCLAVDCAPGAACVSGYACVSSQPTPSPAPVPTPTLSPTPSIAPTSGAYQLRALVGGFLSARSPDDRTNTLTGSATILSPNPPYSSGGRQVDSSASTFAYSGNVVDSIAAKVYKEDERYYLYAKTQYDPSSKAVKAKNPQLAYEAIFTNPIQVCAKFTPGDSTCLDTYKTTKHRVKVKLLGADWLIIGMDNFNSDVSLPSSAVLTLGKEVQYKEFMPVGDKVVGPNGVTAKLNAISFFSPAAATDLPSASFVISDAGGNVIDAVTLQEGGEYSKNGIVIRVFNVFSGLSQASYAQVSVLSDKLALQHGAAVNADNANWRVTLVGGGAQYGHSLARIQLARLVASDLSAGDSLTFITKPQLMKFTFNGLEDVAYDALEFSTGQSSFPTSSTDMKTVDLSYVFVSSSLPQAFDFGPVRTKSFYYITDSVAAGSAIQGMIFYRDPTTSNFVKYVHPSAKVAGDRVAHNYVKYGYSPSASVDLRFDANGIQSGAADPSWASPVIFIPEYTMEDGTALGAFALGVGYGDQSSPRLAAASGLPVAGVAPVIPVAGYYSAYTTSSTGVTAMYEPGFVSPRGSKLDALGLTSVRIKYATSLVHALLTLSQTVTPVPTPAPWKELKQKGFRTRRGSTVDSATLTAITIKYATRDQSAPAPMPSVSPVPVPPVPPVPSAQPILSAPNCLLVGAGCGVLPGSAACCAPASCQSGGLFSITWQCALPIGIP